MKEVQGNRQANDKGSTSLETDGVMLGSTRRRFRKVCFDWLVIYRSTNNFNLVEIFLLVVGDFSPSCRNNATLATLNKLLMQFNTSTLQQFRQLI